MPKNKFTLKKIVSFLHLWLGLLSGLVIFIVSITGAILVFQEEIMRLSEKKVTKAKNTDYTKLKPLNFSKTIQLANDSLQKIVKEELYTQPSYIWYGAEGGAQPFVFLEYEYKNTENSEYITVETNPFTSKITSIRGIKSINNTPESFEDTFWDTIINLHMNLLF
ncbi:MAG: PepSY domain-containing protein, partial [Leadbetterella sp.]